jgi:peptidoglycan hydrolase CwlO-like protein
MNALINTATPSSLEGVNTQVLLVGVDDEDIESQQQIYSHAVQVMFHYSNMKNSAMHVCIHLYLCREKFKSKSADAGWQVFCKENFAKLDMQMTHIRSAVRTGRALMHALHSQTINNDPKARDTFSQMSRYALTTFSESPEEIRESLATRLITLAEEKGRAPTSTDVRAEVSELLAEINDKNDALKRKDDALTRMNTELQAADARVGELRETVERLNREITRLSTTSKTDVVVVEPGDETSQAAIRDAQAKLQNVTEALSRAKEDLHTVEAERDQIQEDVAKLKEESENSRRERSMIKSLIDDLSSIKAKWSTAFITHSGKDVPPATKERLTEAVMELRALADKLESACLT